MRSIMSWLALGLVGAFALAAPLAASVPLAGAQEVELGPKATEQACPPIYWRLAAFNGEVEIYTYDLSLVLAEAGVTDDQLYASSVEARASAWAKQAYHIGVRCGDCWQLLSLPCGSEPKVDLVGDVAFVYRQYIVGPQNEPYYERERPLFVCSIDVADQAARAHEYRVWDLREIVDEACQDYVRGELISVQLPAGASALGCAVLTYDAEGTETAMCKLLVLGLDEDGELSLVNSLDWGDKSRAQAVFVFGDHARIIESPYPGLNIDHTYSEVGVLGFEPAALEQFDTFANLRSSFGLHGQVLGVGDDLVFEYIYSYGLIGARDAFTGEVRRLIKVDSNIPLVDGLYPVYLMRDAELAESERQ